jgi:hypothetical protein
VITLLVVAMVVVPLVVPSEKWTQIAFERLEVETGLLASAESSRISIIPLGLRMNGLQVRDPQNRPEYAGLELDLQQVVVTAQVKPLFSGRFEIDEVNLVKPRVVLSPAPAEPAGARASQDGTPSGAAVSLALAAISVEDGYVAINQPDGSQTVIHGLNNLSSLRIEGEDGRASAKGALDSLVLVPAEGPRQTVRALDWQLAAEFTADGNSGSVEIERGSVPGATFSGTAAWETAELTSVDAEFSVEADLAALADEWYRPEDIEWPEGVDPDQFGDFRGSFTGELTFAGAIDPEATPEDLASLITVDGTLKDVGGRILDRDDLATLHAEVRFANARLDVEPLRVVMPVGELEGRYSARPLSEDDAHLEMAGNVELQSAAELAAGLWPALQSFMEEGATPPDEWPSVRGELQMQFSADLPVDPEQLPRVTWSAHAAEITARPVDLDADFVLRDVRLSGDAENIAWEEGVVTGPGLELRPRLDVVLNGEATNVTGRIDATSIDLDELQAKLAPPVETAMGNWFVGVAHASEELWVPPENLSADIDLSAAEVLASGHVLRDVSGNASLLGQKVAVRDIRALLGEGEVRGVADVDYVQDPPVWSTRLEATGVPAATLLMPDAPKLAGALDTSFSGEIKFDGKVLTDPEAATKELSGELSLGAAAGLLRTEPVIGSQISQFVGQYAPKWQELAFRALEADLRVDRGFVHFDRFLLSGDTEVRVGGMVGLDGRCDYRLDVVLPASATPDVGALQPVVDYLRDDQGRFPFAVNVTGPAAKPKVQVDFDALRERAEERGQDELQDAVEDAVSGLLDKFKGKK